MLFIFCDGALKPCELEKLQTTLKMSLENVDQSTRGGFFFDHISI